MSTTAAGIQYNTVSTTQQAPLGFILERPTANQGTQLWIYVQANGTLTPGMVCARGTGAAALTYDVIECIIVGAGTAGRADCFTAGAGLAVNSGFGWASADATEGNPAVCNINCVG